MRIFMLTAAGLVAATAFPASAEAQGWRGDRDDWRELREEQRECRRELRRADSRREYHRELRECHREIAEAHRELRRDWRDHRRGRGWGSRWNNPHHPSWRNGRATYRYWDGRRWRYR